MIWEDIINFLRSFVKHYNSIMMGAIDSEYERYIMNAGHAKSHEQEIRILNF